MGIKQLLAHKDIHDFAGRLGDAGTRTEDGGYTCLVEEVVVLSGNDTAGNDQDLLEAQFLELFD